MSRSTAIRNGNGNRNKIDPQRQGSPKYEGRGTAAYDPKKDQD